MEELLYEIAAALRKKAEAGRIKISQLRINRVYSIKWKGKTVPLNIDISLLLKEVKIGVLFIKKCTGFNTPHFSVHFLIPPTRL